MVTDSELTIDCFEEKTNVRVLANSPAINVKVGQFSRISTNLSETGGVLRVQNTSVSEDLAVESIDILSLASQLFIDEVVATNSSSSVLIQALQSQLALKTNASQAKLTSARQAIEILGVNHSIPAPLFQPSQLAPSEEMDRAFSNIGPYATQSPGQTTNNSQSFDSKAEIPVNQLPDVLTGASPSLPLPTPTTFTINSTNFFHVTVDPNAMERVTAVDSAGGISSTTFPLPDPSLLHSNVQEDGEVIHVENGWTRTTKADNFVIGQYENGNNINEHGSTPTTTGSSESMATSDSTFFPIFATISAIDVQAVINDTGEEEGTIQDSAEQQPPGKLRRLRHLTVGSPPHNNQQSSNSKLLVELKVKVTQPINLSPEDLKLKLERHLNTVANSALNSPGIDNHPMTIIEVMDAHLASDFSNSSTYPTLIIHLMVQTGSMQNFPAIVEQLNQLDELVLDEELGNRIFSDMRVKRRSPAIYSILQSFAFIPAGILIISVSFAIVFWAVGAKSLFYKIFVRSIRSYRNRRRVQSIRSEVDSRKTAVDGNTPQICIKLCKSKLETQRQQSMVDERVHQLENTKFSIASVPDQPSNTRQLSVAVVSPTYQMQLRLEGAEVMVIDSELTIDCFEEKTNVRVLANSPAINVKVGQFSRISTNLSETGGVLRVQNTGVSEDLAVESIDILSLASQLFIDEIVATKISSFTIGMIKKITQKTS
uniref:Uncharacterized protein n=1 Tax=Ditylenchus dipsaci TaxID=166011 RepID=A0A915EPU0_9BILA